MSGSGPTRQPYSKRTVQDWLHRIEQASSAIKARINELKQDHMGTPEERMAIEDALSCLNVLRREVP